MLKHRFALCKRDSVSSENQEERNETNEEDENESRSEIRSRIPVNTHKNEMKLDVPISSNKQTIPEKTKELICLLNSSLVHCNSGNLSEASQLLRPESLLLLGSKALDLVLDLLTDTSSTSHAMFLSDVLGFSNETIASLQNRIHTEESNGNGLLRHKKAQILNAVQDLIVLHNQQESKDEGVEVVVIETSQLYCQEQQLALSVAPREKKMGAAKSIMERFRIGFRRRSTRTCSSTTEESNTKSIATTKSSSQAFETRVLCSSAHSDSNKNKDTKRDNVSLSLGNEVALLVYQWIALTAYDAMQYCSNTRLCTLHQITS